VGLAKEQRLNVCSNSLCLNFNFKCKLKLYYSFTIDLAEFVLNKCITQDDSEMQGGQPVHYNFDYLEKTGAKGTPKSKNQGVHILYWMVSFNSSQICQYNNDTNLFYFSEQLRQWSAKK